MRVRYSEEGQRFEYAETISEALEVLDGTLPVCIATGFGFSVEVDGIQLRHVREKLMEESSNRWGHSPDSRDRQHRWPVVFWVNGRIHCRMSNWSGYSILPDPRRGGEE